VEPDRFDSVVRTLFSTPSRRALVGLTVGTVLAPLLRVGDAVAKDGKKTHKHKHHRKKKRKKDPSSRCPKNYEFCPAGEYSECCAKNPNPQYDPAEVCTDCGCCAFDFSKCCPSAGAGLCCNSNDKCCYADDFKTSACCGPQDICCGAGCCNQGETCCTSTGPNPFKYCCAQGLTCLPSGGNTCQSK
jgi:hypothetical protein